MPLPLIALSQPSSRKKKNSALPMGPQPQDVVGHAEGFQKLGSFLLHLWKGHVLEELYPTMHQGALCPQKQMIHSSAPLPKKAKVEDLIVARIFAEIDELEEHSAALLIKLPELCTSVVPLAFVPSRIVREISL